MVQRIKPKHLDRLHFPPQTNGSEQNESSKTQRTAATVTLTTSDVTGRSDNTHAQSEITQEPEQLQTGLKVISPIIDRSPGNSSNSNCYSISERTLLRWLNQAYEQSRDRGWSAENGEFVKLDERSVINFDRDLSDSIVLAAVIGLHIPSLVSVSDCVFFDFSEVALTVLLPTSHLVETIDSRYHKLHVFILIIR